MWLVLLRCTYTSTQYGKQASRGWYTTERDCRYSASSESQHRCDLHQGRHEPIGRSGTALAWEGSMTTNNTMQRRAQEYLNERRRLGYALSTIGTRLLTFARFADKVGHKGPLTLKLIVDWAKGQATCATPITWARRVEIIRPFAKFCAREEPQTFIPALDMFGPAHRRLTPHIYSDEEITDLLAVAGMLPPKGSLRPATFQALFGLYAATGLRCSEALKLLCSDFDAAQNRLTIRETKFRKSRYVYLHPTVTEQLVRYRKLRDRFIG